MKFTHDPQPVPAYFIRVHLFGVSQGRFAEILTAASVKKDPAAARDIGQSAISKWEGGGGIGKWWSGIIRETAQDWQAKGHLARDWRDEFLHADKIPQDGYKPAAPHAVRRAGENRSKGENGAHRTDERVPA